MSKAGFNGPMARQSPTSRQGSGHFYIERACVEVDSMVQLWHHRDMSARKKELEARAASRDARAHATRRAQQQRELSDRLIAERRAQICRDMQRLWAKGSSPRLHSAGPKDNRTMRAVLPDAAPELLGTRIGSPEYAKIGSSKAARRSPTKTDTFTSALDRPFLDAQADALCRTQASNLEAARQSTFSLDTRQLHLKGETRLRKERHAATVEHLSRELDDERYKVRPLSCGQRSPPTLIPALTLALALTRILALTLAPAPTRALPCTPTRRR